LVAALAIVVLVLLVVLGAVAYAVREIFRAWRRRE
jgi:hypothetical protein